MAKKYFLIQNLEKPISSPDSVIKLAAVKTGIPKEDIEDVVIIRESLDARKKNSLKFVYNLGVSLKSGSILKGYKEYEFPEIDFSGGELHFKYKPVIIGLGPAGIFTAFTLLKKGYCPIIIEQGKSVGERIRDVELLRMGGGVNEKSNVLFGEGGAGTFSDAKLTARNLSAETDFFFKTLIQFGAKKSISYSARPHLGTDRIRKIVPKITAHLKENGAEIHYNTKVLSIDKGAQDTVCVRTDRRDYLSDCVILAIGHSADDLFYQLHRRCVCIEKKTFAVGVRVEHSREFMDSRQYGEMEDAAILGAADYALTAKLSKDRGVYSFCVCPGGEIIHAGSSKAGIAVNGMSYSARDGQFTNGAIVTTVLPGDLPKSPLAGLDLKKRLERECARGAVLYAPVQGIDDFFKGSIRQGVRCTYRPGCYAADINALLPETVVKAIKYGLKDFDTKIKGFIEEGIMVAPETGTSSPVRIVRDPGTFESVNFKGLYPIGEGAGYAGGIVSSAVDGIRLGLKFMRV
jgi:uncharacterized FAD-dependent dehydrogenase